MKHTGAVLLKVAGGGGAPKPGLSLSLAVAASQGAFGVC